MSSKLNAEDLAEEAQAADSTSVASHHGHAVLCRNSLLGVLQLYRPQRGLPTASGHHLHTAHTSNLQQRLCNTDPISIDDDTNESDSCSGTDSLDREQVKQNENDAIQALTNPSGVDNDRIGTDEMDTNAGMGEEEVECRKAEDDDVDDDDEGEKIKEFKAAKPYRKMSVNSKRKSFRLTKDGQLVENLEEEAIEFILGSKGDVNEVDAGGGGACVLGPAEEETESADDDFDRAPPSYPGLGHSNDGGGGIEGAENLDDGTRPRTSTGSMPDILFSSPSGSISPGTHPIESICNKNVTDIHSGNTSSDGEQDTGASVKSGDHSKVPTPPSKTSYKSWDLPLDVKEPCERKTSHRANQRNSCSDQSQKKRDAFRSERQSSSGYGDSKGSQQSSAQLSDDEVFDKVGNDDRNDDDVVRSAKSRRVSSGIDVCDDADGEDYSKHDAMLPMTPHSTNTFKLPCLLTVAEESSSRSGSYSSSESVSTETTRDTTSSEQGACGGGVMLPTTILGLDSASIDSEKSESSRESSGNRQPLPTVMENVPSPQIPVHVLEMTVSLDPSSIPVNPEVHVPSFDKRSDIYDNIHSREKSTSHVTWAQPVHRSPLEEEVDFTKMSYSCSSSGSASGINIQSQEQIQRHFEKTQEKFCKDYYIQNVLSSGASVEEIHQEFEKFPAVPLSCSSGSSRLQLCYLPSTSGTGSSSSDGMSMTTGSPFTPHSNISGHDFVFQDQYSVEIRPEGSLYDDGYSREQVIQQLVMAAQCQWPQCPDQICRQGQKYLTDLTHMIDQVEFLNDSNLSYHLQILECLRCHSNTCEEMKCAVPWCSYLNKQPEYMQLFCLLKDMHRHKLKKLMQPIYEHDDQYKFIKMCARLPFDNVPCEPIDWVTITTLGDFGHTVMAMPAFPEAQQHYWVIKKMTDGRDHSGVFKKLADKSHPFIVLHLWAECGMNHTYLCTEFLTSAGGSLKENLNREACLTNQNVRYVLSQLLDATRFLHHNDIAYLNWTMSNILVDTRSKSVMLSDFSVAVLISEQRTEEDLEDIKPTIPATAMPPEICECESIISKSDMWGIGMIAYEVLKGHSIFDTHPYRHLEPIELRKHVCQMNMDEIIPPETCDLALWRLIKRCWQRQPEERLSADEFLHMLQC